MALKRKKRKNWKEELIPITKSLSDKFAEKYLKATINHCAHERQSSLKAMYIDGAVVFYSMEKIHLHQLA